MSKTSIPSFGRIAAVMLIAAGLLLGGCRSARIDQSTAERFNKSPPTAAPGGLPAAPVIGSTDYRLGPLDVLDIEVFGVKDLTRTVRLSASGQFSMPFVGVVAADGKTIAELEKQIATQLSANYLENPQVTVYVKEYNSQRVTVEGAVVKPGIYPLTGRTSLLQMMAMSEGLEPDANLGGVVIYRTIEGKRAAAVFDIKKIRAGEMVDPEVLGNDLVVVDVSGGRSGLRDMIWLTPLMAIFMVL